MNEFTIVTHIARPVEEVFGVITDVARTPVWSPGLSEARQTSQGPLQPGATLVYAGTFLGRRYLSPVVCTGLTENKRFATKTSAGPFYLEVDIKLEPSADGTRVTNTCRGDSRGFFKLAEPLVVRLTRKQSETAFANLRTLLEEGAL
jgi:carbon monoxide dehydrogenase subunit G